MEHRKCQGKWRVKQKWLVGVMAVLVLFIGAGIGVGNYFVEYALSPESDSAYREIDEEDALYGTADAEAIIKTNNISQWERGQAFALTTAEASIQSGDGLTLKGQYRQAADSSLWAIIVHGYKSNNLMMMEYGVEYHGRGYNVLLPDNRAHGDSEGRYIGMGWLDKDDLALWIRWILQQDSNARIVVHGTSMGAAATMMLAGDAPEQVVAYIEDCGYTGVWDIFASELDKRFSLPTFPVLNFAQVVAQFKAGYDFRQASALKQVQRCQKPMLFIHGGKDDFVPVEMGYALYEAAECPKDLYIVEEAGHAEAKNYDPEMYWDRVFAFIQANVPTMETA